MSHLKYVKTPFDNDASYRYKLSLYAREMLKEELTHNMVITITPEVITRNDLLSKIVDANYTFDKMYDLIMSMTISIEPEELASFYIDRKSLMKRIDKTKLTNEVRKYYYDNNAKAPSSFDRLYTDYKVNLSQIITILYNSLKRTENNPITQVRTLVNILNIAMTDLELIVLYANTIVNENDVKNALSVINEYAYTVDSPRYLNLNNIRGNVLYLTNIIRQFIIPMSQLGTNQPLELMQLWRWLTRNDISIGEIDLIVLFTLIRRESKYDDYDTLPLILQFQKELKIDEPINDQDQLESTIKSWKRSVTRDIENEKHVVTLTDAIYFAAGTSISFIRQFLNIVNNANDANDAILLSWDFINIREIKYNRSPRIMQFLAEFSIARDEQIYDGGYSQEVIAGYNQLTLKAINNLLYKLSMQPDESIFNMALNELQEVNQQKEISISNEILNSLLKQISNKNFTDYSSIQQWALFWFEREGAYQPKLLSPFRVKTIVVGTFPRLIGNDISEGFIDINDGIYIFDKASLNKLVPLLHYNKGNLTEGDSGSKSFIKVYQGPNPDEETRYDKLIHPSDSFNKADHLYFKTYQEPDSATFNLESYQNADYNLVENRLEFDVNVKRRVTKNDVIDSIHATMPFRINETFVSGVKGEFEMYNVELNMVHFLHAVMNDLIMRSYLYVQETTNTTAKELNRDHKIKFDYRTLVDSPEIVIINGVRKSIRRKKQSRANLRFTIKQAYGVEKQRFLISLPEKKTYARHTIVEESVPLRPRIPYIIVSVSEARSRSDVNDFLVVFSHLISYYEKNLQKKIADFYNSFVPEINIDIKRAETTKTKKKKTMLSRKEVIKAYEDEQNSLNPDRISIFEDTAAIKKKIEVGRYSKACQCPRQPILIPNDENVEEEILAWKQYLVRKPNTDQYIEREVLAYPPPPLDVDLSTYKPEFYFVCPGNIHPFPGVVKTPETWANRSIYKGLPCCFSTVTTAPESNSTYNKLYRGKEEPKKSITSSSSYAVGVKFPVEYGRYGSIFPIVEQSIKGVPQFAEGYDVMRRGVVHDKNSFIHCILEATSPQYRAESQKNKTKLATDFRAKLPSFINVAAVRQEMYDFSDEQIIAKMTDADEFFDSHRFYRALEEYANVNIYVFNNKIQKKKDDNPFIEIPRNKIIHIRPNPEHTHEKLRRPTVLVYKYWGTSSSKRPYPQCDLIVLRPTDRTISDTNTMMQFKPSTNIDVHMWKIMHQQVETITWLFADNKYRLTAHLNVFSQINYMNLLMGMTSDQYSANLMSQIVDKNGKARAFTLKTVTTNEQVVRTTIIVPPSQPLNLPLTQDITKTQYNLVLGMFKEMPTAMTTKLHNGIDYVTGFWYRLMNIKHALYCPVELVPVNSLPSDTAFSSLLQTSVDAPNNPLQATGQNKIMRVRILKRKVQIILEAVLWLFVISELDYKNFVKMFLFLGNDYTINDSNNIYDTSKVDRRWPSDVNLTSAFDYLQEKLPGLITIKNNSYRIHAYSKKFYEGISYFLRDFQHKTIGLPMKVPRGVETLLESRDDFKKQERVIIFTSKVSLQNWLDKRMSPSYSTTTLQLNYTYANDVQPYIFYSHNHSKYYLIQNVKAERFGQSDITNRIVLNRAINVAYQWYLRHVNIGFTDVEFEPRIVDGSAVYPSYVVYVIAQDSDLGLAKDMTNSSNSSNNYLQVLEYTNGQYAAVLPLL